MTAKVLYHSSIRAEGEKVVYFDPFKIAGEPHDADIIFVTHDHFDHYSPEDIGKIIKPDTVVVFPRSMEGKTGGFGTALFVEPNESFAAAGISARAVPAYNVGKPFHPRENGWVGYIVTLGGERIYVAGDTDVNSDVKTVKCDAAFLPVGGKYTMNAAEAAELANIIKPKKVVPTHYGEVAGSPSDGVSFAALVDKDIKVEIQLKF